MPRYRLSLICIFPNVGIIVSIYGIIVSIYAIIVSIYSIIVSIYGKIWIRENLYFGVFHAVFS